MAKAEPAGDEKLKRERAGTYRTGDGRFTVEQTSSGWLVMDAEQTDELGLALARGPFATLDDARAAIGVARSGPAPTSTVAAPKAATKPAVKSAARTSPISPADPQGTARTPLKRPPLKAPPARRKPEVVIREIRAVDGDALRALWRDAGIGSVGDDDRSLARLARRNPSLVLVASEGSRVVGSALGAWDGRRGWIYHLAVVPAYRRRGIATRLIDQIEEALISLGCPKVNVMIRPESDGAGEFWTGRGYVQSPARGYGRELKGS